MKAIIVKYLGPTDTKGSRLKAMAEGVKSIIRGLDYSINISDDMFNIAQELCKRNNWPSNLVAGQLPNGDYVFCFGGLTDAEQVKQEGRF